MSRYLEMPQLYADAGGHSVFESVEVLPGILVAFGVLHVLGDGVSDVRGALGKDPYVTVIESRAPLDVYGDFKITEAEAVVCFIDSGSLHMEHELRLY